jgi:hypothetical protein
MSESFTKKDFLNAKRENVSMTEIKNSLNEKNACYVLLTCSHPTKDGNMMVEVAYEGDECIASYLVDNAQHILDEQIRNSEA